MKIKINHKRILTIQKRLLKLKSIERTSYFMPRKEDTDVQALERRIIWVTWYFPNEVKVPFADQHKDLIVVYNNAGFRKKNFISLFYGGRRTGKTSLCKLFDIYDLVYGVEKFIAIMSSDKSKATEYVSSCWNMINTPRMIADYGLLAEEKRDISNNEKTSNTRSQFFLRHNYCYIKSYGALSILRNEQVYNRKDQKTYRITHLRIEDFENSDTVRSESKTLNIEARLQESFGSFESTPRITVTANYISKKHNIQKHFINKDNVKKIFIAGTDFSVSQTQKEADELNKKYNTDLYVSKETIIELFGERYFNTEIMGVPLDDGDELFDIKEKPSIDFKKSGIFKIYEDYKEGNEYIVGIDTGKGVGLNKSVAVVLNQHTNEIVAVGSSNKLSVRDFAESVAHVCEQYKGIIYSIESNGIGEAMVSSIVEKVDKGRVLSENKETRKNDRPMITLGINITQGKKHIGLDAINYAIIKDELKLKDADLIKDLKLFTQEDIYKTRTQSDQSHFDYLSALIILYVGLKKGFKRTIMTPTFI